VAASGRFLPVVLGIVSHKRLSKIKSKAHKLVGERLIFCARSITLQKFITPICGYDFQIENIGA